MQKLTTEEFVKKAVNVHGDLYGYDKSIYTLTKNKLTIHCNIHGDFEQTPNNHLRGKGCHKCAGSVPLSTAEFIDNANKIHTFKYSYDSTIYERSYQHVTITCPKHGDFKQTPNNHLRGKGCPQCGHNNLTEDLFEEYLQEFFPSLPYLRDCPQPHLKTTNGTRRYDFLIPSIKMNIEIDGRQHFEPIREWGGKSYLLEIQKADKWKDKMSSQVGIHVYRVPYTKFKASMKKSVTRKYFKDVIYPLINSCTSRLNSDNDTKRWLNE